MSLLSSSGAHAAAPMGFYDGEGREASPSESFLGLPPKTRSSWQLLAALGALSVTICYADRTNIATAILPMSKGELKREKFHVLEVGSDLLPEPEPHFPFRRPSLT